MRGIPVSGHGLWTHLRWMRVPGMPIEPMPFGSQWREQFPRRGSDDGYGGHKTAFA